VKITFDMQAFQSTNRIGGIGKYNHDFLSTLFSLYPENEYNLVYNQTSQLDVPLDIKGALHLNKKVIRYFPGNDWNFFNKWIYRIGFSSIQSNVTHILSPFETQSHCVIPSSLLPKNTVITLYDFIPYLYKDLYLRHPLAWQHYSERLKILRSASLILSISEATRQDAIRLFQVSEDKIVNVGIAPSSEYYREPDNVVNKSIFTKYKYQIPDAFVLTVSNLDHRKNLKSLLKAYSFLPLALREAYPLVLVTNSLPEHIEKDPELQPYLDYQTHPFNLIILYSVSNNELRTLYNTCTLFVYASLYEGGGLPVVEAMRCGAPVVASNTSSIPEFAGRIDNLFDPKNIDDIRNAIENILTNETFRQEIQRHGLEFSKTITWEKVVTKAMKAYKNLL
jgi:glycosyltransferase involved in cell wall biosynthesis